MVAPSTLLWRANRVTSRLQAHPLRRPRPSAAPQSAITSPCIRVVATGPMSNPSRRLADNIEELDLMLRIGWEVQDLDPSHNVPLRR